MDLIDRQHLISVMCNHCTAQERCKTNHEEGECDDFDMLIIRNEPKVDSNEWIPVKWSEITDEERPFYNADVDWLADFKTPKDGEEILICDKNGHVTCVKFCNDDDYGIGDDCENDWVEDVVAWMPLPKGYIKQSETIVEE